MAGAALAEKYETASKGGTTNNDLQLADLEATFIDPRIENTYDCPLYRTSARYGTLLTTGHSTNFIIMVSTPLPQDMGDGDTNSPKTKSANDRRSSNHWIKRGAAMVCSLSN